MRKILIAAFFLAAAPAAAAIPSPFPPLRPDQARANLGENVIIEGTAAIHDAERRDGWYIDLNGHGPSSPFAGFIPYEDLNQFPHLQEMDGKRVDITGIVQLRRGVPIIIMTSAYQLRPAAQK